MVVPAISYKKVTSGITDNVEEKLPSNKVSLIVSQNVFLIILRYDSHSTDSNNNIFPTIFLKLNFLKVTVENTSRQIRNLNIHVSITEFCDEDIDVEFIMHKKIQT